MKKQKTEFRRKAELLTLVALGTISISGSFAYVSVKDAQKNNGSISDGNVITPDVSFDDEDTTQDALGYILNNMLSCKSMNIKNLDIVANPGSGSTQATIGLSDLGVDLSKLNTTNISATGKMAVSFGGYETQQDTLNNTLTTSMSFELEDLTTLYLSAFSGNFRLSAPRTIAQVSSLINKFTPSSENKPAQTSNNTTDIMSIVDKVKEIISGNDKTVGLKIIDNNQDTITISINDLTFGETGKTKTIISGLKIVLGYERTEDEKGNLTDANLTSLTVGSMSEPIKIQQQYNGSDVYDVLTALYITTGKNGIVVDKQNGITLSDHTTYTDMTDPNQSIFSTVGDIFMKDSTGSKIMAKANIGLTVDIDDYNSSTYETTGNFMSFNGSLKLDASNVSQFLSTSKMLMEINNVKKPADAASMDGFENLDTLKVYYSGGNTGAAYINFDNAYKVKLDNTASSSLVDYMSKNGENIISSIVDQVQAALKAIPTDTIKEGAEQQTKTSEIIDKICDFIYQKTGSLPSNNLNDLIRFEYSPGTGSEGSFVFSLRKDLLGMKQVDKTNSTDHDWMKVSVNITTDKVSIKDGKIDESYKGRIQNVTVSGVDVLDKTITVKIDMSKITDVTIDSDQFTSATDYVSINGTVGIIKTLGNYIINQKGGVNYALTYLPENKDTSSSFGLSGSIGVDLSEIDTFKQLGKDNGVLGLTSSQFYFTSRIATENKADVFKNHERNLEVSYKKETDNKRNLYFSYDDCFKNYVSDASISDICSVLDNKVSSQSSDAPAALEGMNKVLSFLGVSQKFQNDLKSIIQDKTLRNLKSFLSVKQGEESQDIVILSLNTGYIFEGTDLAKKVASIDVTIDASTEEFKSITVGGYRDNSNALLEFKLDFTEFKLPTTDYSNYAEIKDASSIFNSFYNLPTTLNEYGIGIHAKLNDDNKNQLVVGMDSGLVIDRNHSNYDGAVVISHPSLSNLDGGNSIAKQKIEFAYDTTEKTDSGYVSVADPTFVAEYNDRMHIKMGSSSVKDLVSTISDDKSTHYLLTALTSLENVATGLPVQSAIQTKDASILLENRIIDKVVFDDAKNQIVLTMFASLFNSEAKDVDKVSVTISYTEDKDSEGNKDHSLAKLNSVSLKGLTLSGKKSIEASISLEENYQNTLDNAVKETTTGETSFHVAKPSDAGVSFVDLADFNDLIKAGIDTTNFNYYSLAGNISLDLTAWLQESKININEFSFDLNLKYTLFLADGKAYMDFYINRGTDDEFADFKFCDDYVYVTSTNHDNNEGKYKSYRMKKSEASTKNGLLYLILTEALDIDSHIAGRTLMAQLYSGFNNPVVNPDDTATISTQSGEGNDASSDTASTSKLPLTLGISDDFSSILSQTAIKSSVDSTVDGEKLDMWSFVLNLNSIFTNQSDLKNLVSFGETKMDIYDMALRSQDENNNWVRTATPLYGMNLKTAINLLPGTYGDNSQVASIKLGMSLHANYTNNRDGYGVISDDTLKKFRDGDGTEEATDNVENGISSYFQCIHAIDKAVKDNFSISSITLKSKELYDFASGNLINFYNDYALVTTDGVVYTNNLQDYYKE